MSAKTSGRKSPGSMRTCVSSAAVTQAAVTCAARGTKGSTSTRCSSITQSGPRGGEGWLRLLEFLPDDRTVRVRTYSTRLDQWDTSAGDDFTFLLTPVSTTGRIQHDARCRIAGCTENRTPGEAGTSETALARLLHSREVERKSDDLNPKMRSSPACSTGQAGRFPELASPVHLTAPPR